MSDGRKVCPMKYNKPPNSADPDFYCDGEQCAWWIGNEQSCCVPHLANLPELTRQMIEAVWRARR